MGVEYINQFFIWGIPTSLSGISSERAPKRKFYYVECLCDGWGTLLRIVIALLLQSIVSTIYVAINYHLTAMIQMQEWGKLAHR
jgi:hypothetical protein